MSKIYFKFFTLTIYLILIFQNSYSQQNVNGWYWINNQPQGNNLNWVKIIDPANYYAVGNNGTFMKSSDGGNSWLINSQAGVTDTDNGTGGTLNLQTGWFFDANTGLVAGQSNDDTGGKIRRTTNGGQTFSTIELGNAPGSPIVYDFYFINSNTGYLCGNGIVRAFKTTNAGLNWTLFSNLPDYYSYRCIYALDENNIIIGLGSNSGDIVRTTNGGVTWIDQELPGTDIIDFTDIQFQNAQTGFIGGKNNFYQDSYFAYTTDGGVNWTKTFYQGIINQGGVFELKVLDSTVYALSSYKTYYYTSNLGTTWDSVNYSDIVNPNYYNSEGYAFDIKGSDAIVVAQFGKVNVSNDSGFNWQNKNYSIEYPNLSSNAIYALPATEKVWTCGNHGVVNYSSNNGTNWILQHSGKDANFFDILMVNSNTGYAVGRGFNEIFFAHYSQTFKTTNGGSDWFSFAFFSYLNLGMIDFVNPDTGWITLNYGIYKTTNGGDWFGQELTPPQVAIDYLDMFDANTGYAINVSTLRKTTNGNTWNVMNSLTTGSLFKRVKAISNNTVYLVTNQKLYKSFNGGITWDSTFLSLSSADIYDMDWTDINNGVVIGSGGYTAKTSNGGATWVERNTGTNIKQVSMASKDTVYVTGSGTLRQIDNTPNLTTIIITVGIEGFWNGIDQVNDTVKCHLRNSVSPFEEIDVASAVTGNSGIGTFQFSIVPSGSYYLEMSQRNSIETWSSLPLTISSGGNYNYDFTSAIINAFGNNQILKSGKYCFYSGDVNQDGYINLIDLLDASAESENFASGYIPADVNGDNMVDLNDVAMVYNNSEKFISKITP